MYITYRYRVKDKHSQRLAAQAEACNFIWNYCNETQRKAIRAGRKWLTGYDLGKLVAGATKEGLDLHSHTAMRVCQEYAKACHQNKKPWLRWRGRRSLGWVPFNTNTLFLRKGVFIFRGEAYGVWLHRKIPEGAKLGAGSFNRDSHGRWYINVPVDIDTADSASVQKVGIDLGLTFLATLSTGEKIEAPQLYRKSEATLATAQRARKAKRTRAIHAKVRRRRNDHLHKHSKRIAKKYGFIVIGDDGLSTIAQSQFAKSVFDASWATFKRMLSYKAIMHGGHMLEVPERNTSQTCSECGRKPASRPRGIAGLRKRTFECDDCGVIFDRDVNAARNILRLGQQTLGGGAQLLRELSQGVDLPVGTYRPPHSHRSCHMP